MGLLAAILLVPALAVAEPSVVLTGTVTAGGLDHVRLPFTVPAGVAELEVAHDDLDPDDILDFGLDDPAGFRGWGGGNTEPIVVNAQAASRSYRPGPITAGTWSVVVGKAKLVGGIARYRVEVTLRAAPSLPPQPDRKAYAPSPPRVVGRRWYAGDLHAHSRESGDARPSVEELARFARAQGLDFVELSDHNTTTQLDFIADAQARVPDVLLIPGFEFTTYAGHANAIGATRWVDHKLGQPGVTIEGAAAEIRAQGALLSINHPLFDLGPLCIGCAWQHALAPEAIDAVEVATAGSPILFGESTIAWWDALCARGRHVAAVGGSDDHGAGQGLGPFGAPIGTPTTYVLADALDVASILEGIRRGRTVVKLGGPSDPMIELEADDLDGDTIRALPAKLRATIRDGAGLEARWVVDGTPEPSTTLASAQEALFRAQGAPGRVRLEVLRDGRVVTVTSHLWVEAPPPKPSGCGVAGSGSVGAALAAMLWGWMRLGRRKSAARRGS